MANLRDFDNVILIDENGEKLGTFTYRQAQDIAADKGLDLLEIDGGDKSKVVKIIDKGKWKYEQKKKQKHNKQHHMTTKEVKFSMKIDVHDQTIKVNHIREFLTKGHTVRTVIQLKGREKQHFGLAVEKLQNIIVSLSDVGKMSERGINRSNDSVSVDLFSIKHKVP